WCFPGLVCSYYLFAAIRILHMELRHETHRWGTKAKAAQFPAKRAPVPALAQGYAYGVFTLLQQRGNIISLVDDAVVVIGPVRSKHGVSDSLSVNFSTVAAKCRNIDARRGGRLGGGKLFPMHGGRPDF